MVGKSLVNPFEYFIKIVAVTSRAIATNNHSQLITAAFWYEPKGNSLILRKPQRGVVPMSRRNTAFGWQNNTGLSQEP